jgi:hypothetical protein
MKRFVNAFNTGIQIQNTGSDPATVWLYCENREGDAYSVNVPARGTYVFATRDESFLPDGYSGSVRLFSDQPIVGIVNQINDLGTTGDSAMSFGMFIQN